MSHPASRLHRGVQGRLYKLVDLHRDLARACACVLVLSQFYPPTIGGEERHVRSLSTALAVRGHEVAGGTQWREGLAERDIDQGVRGYRLRGTMARVDRLFSEVGRRHVPPCPDPEMLWGLRRVLAKEQPDVVHAHNWLIRAYLPLKALVRAKLVLTLHDYSLICAKKRLMYHGTPCSGPRFAKCLGCAVDHYMTIDQSIDSRYRASISALA